MDGQDLILATGTPGSRWSGTLRAISTNPNINISDEKSELEYAREYVTDSGEVKQYGWHRGAYWGPYHNQGQRFDNLQDMTKDEIIKEFIKPYEDFSYGVKIIKSHWFAYHLPLLQDLFPKAKIMAVYMPSEFCFDWWRNKVGGWNITYPHYDWYENDERMIKQIEIENSNIENFFDLKKMSIYDVFESLGLPNEFRSEEELILQDSKLKDLSKNRDYKTVLNNTVSRNFTGIK